MNEKEWIKIRNNCPSRQGDGWQGFVCTANSNDPNDGPYKAGCDKMKDCLIIYLVEVLENRKIKNEQ